MRCQFSIFPPSDQHLRRTRQCLKWHKAVVDKRAMLGADLVSWPRCVTCRGHMGYNLDDLLPRDILWRFVLKITGKQQSKFSPARRSDEFLVWLSTKLGIFGDCCCLHQATTVLPKSLQYNIKIAIPMFFEPGGRCFGFFLIPFWEIPGSAKFEPFFNDLNTILYCTLQVERRTDECRGLWRQGLVTNITSNMRTSTTDVVTLYVPQDEN